MGNDKEEMSQNSNEYDREYYKKNRGKILASKARKRKEYPYLNIYRKAKARCTCQTNKDYKYYGGRGIKFLLTVDEIKELWFRDKAYLLIRPSIDREDNDGNYEFDNCQFIEMGDNTRKRFKGIVKIPYQVL